MQESNSIVIARPRTGSFAEVLLSHHFDEWKCWVDSYPKGRIRLSEDKREWLRTAVVRMGTDAPVLEPAYVREKMNEYEVRIIPPTATHFDPESWEVALPGSVAFPLDLCPGGPILQEEDLPQFDEEFNGVFHPVSTPVLEVGHPSPENVPRGMIMTDRWGVFFTGDLMTPVQMFPEAEYRGAYYYYKGGGDWAVSTVGQALTSVCSIPGLPPQRDLHVITLASQQETRCMSELVFMQKEGLIGEAKRHFPADEDLILLSQRLLTVHLAGPESIEKATEIAERSLHHLPIELCDRWLSYPV